MRVLILIGCVAALAGCDLLMPKKPEPAAPPPVESPAQLAAKAVGLAGDAVLTPESVQALITAHGAQTTVLGIANSGAVDQGGLWGQVEAGVASGADGWLGLVPALTLGVDAGTAEGLKLAVQSALTVNAPGALKLIGEARPVTDVCTIGLIEPTPEQLKTAKDAAVKAVTAVKDPALKDAKAACLAELAKVAVK
jgi:hypothetical protein